MLDAATTTHGVVYVSPSSRAISPGSSSSPALTVASAASLRWTATTEFPLVATDTVTTSPEEKVKPGVPAASTLAESRPGLPRRDSLSQRPSLTGCRCGERSRS